MSDECRMCEKQDWDTKEPVGLWKRARRTSPGTAPHYPHSHTTHQDLVRGIGRGVIHVRQQHVQDGVKIEIENE